MPAQRSGGVVVKCLATALSQTFVCKYLSSMYSSMRRGGPSQLIIQLSNPLALKYESKDLPYRVTLITVPIEYGNDPS